MAFVPISGINTAKPTPSFTPIGATIAPSISQPVAPVPASQPSFFDKIGGAISSGINTVTGAIDGAVQGAGNILANMYGTNIQRGLSETQTTPAEEALKPFAAMVGGANPENLPLGVGKVVSASKEFLNNPQTPNVTFGDWLNGMKTATQGIAGQVISGATEIPNIATAGQYQPQIKFNLPGIGEISNSDYKIADRVAKGEDPSTVVMQEKGQGFLNALFFIGLASEPFLERPTVIGETKSTEVPTGNGIVTAEPMKSFQRYVQPSYSTPLSDAMVQKLANEQGVTMPETYDPSLPTYFKMMGTSGGKITTQVIQIKPSYFQTFLNVLKGDVSKVPSTELVPIISQGTSIKAIENTKAITTSVTATEVSKPTPSFQPLKIGAQTESVIPETPQTAIQYHGSPTSLSGELQPSKTGTLGEGFYLTQTPERAGSFSKQTKTMTGAGTVTSPKANININSFDTSGLKLKVLDTVSDISNINEYRQTLQSQGYDGIELSKSGETVVFPESMNKLKNTTEAPVAPESAPTAPIVPKTGETMFTIFDSEKNAIGKVAAKDFFYAEDKAKALFPDKYSYLMKESTPKVDASPLAREAQKYSSSAPETAPKTSNQYHALTYQPTGNKFVPVEGKAVAGVHPEAEFFIHRSTLPHEKGWVVSEVRSGMKVGYGMTKEKAIQSAKDLIAKNKGTSLKDIVESQVKKNGLSPRFKSQEVTKTTATENKPETSQAYKEIQPEPKPSEPSTLNKGFVSPANVVEDVQKAIKNAQDFIDESKKQVKYSGNLEQDHYLLANREEIDRIASLQLAKEAKGTPADYTQIYHYIENKSEPLTDKQRLIYESEIQPIEKESKALYEKLRNEGVPINDEGYIHRIVADKGGIVERMKAGFSGSSEGGLLRKTTSSFKHRTMMALEDAQGNRKIVSIKGDRVVALQKGTSEYLGNTKTRGSEYPKFIDKNGKMWNVGQATTKEIEANTSTTYHKNALVSELVNYNNLKKVDRAIEYLEELKTNPEFERVGIKVGTQNIPDGYRTTELPQLRGYMFPKRIAEVFDDFYHQRAQTGLGEVYGKVNRVLRNSIFFNPLIHIPNIAVHWAVNRGVVTLANPLSYPRLISTSMRAIRATLTMNQDYINVLNKGGSLMYSKNATHDLPKLLLNKMGMELDSNKTLAGFISKELGYINPVRLVKAIYNFSSDATWAANDIATLQSVFEEMDNGVSIEKAIEDTGKHIPNYRIPARVLGSRSISNLMRRDSGVTMFGAYHYGALKSYGEMLKSVEEGMRGKVPPKDIADALDKIAALILITYFLYPLLDKIARWATGNQKAQLRRAGATTFLINTQKIIQSSMQRGALNAPDVSTYIQSVLTPSVGIKGATELYFGRSTFTGQPTNYMTELGSLLSPVSYAQKIVAGDLTPKNFVLGLMGISSPKTTPSERTVDSMIFDDRPNILNQVKDLYLQNKIPQAETMRKDFNTRLVNTANDALTEAGQKQLPVSVMALKLKGYIINVPTATVLKNYEAKTTSDKSFFTKLTQ